MPQDVKQAQAEPMSALRLIDGYPAAAEVLGATTVVLDANFCEQFLHTVYRWDERHERRSAQIRRAFAYIQTCRNRTAADYLAMPAAIELVRSIAAHQSTEAMFAFVSQISETFDANVVEALFGAPYYLGSADDETKSFLEGLGRDAAQALRLKLAHRPPRLYRFFVTQLFGAYQQNQMLDLLRERIWMVDTALAATVTVVLESVRARDELTDEHIHFAASLATRVDQFSAPNPPLYLKFSPEVH